MDLAERILTYINYYHVQILAAELLFFIGFKRRLNNFYIIILFSLFLVLPFFIPETYFWNGFMVTSWFSVGFILIFAISAVIIYLIFVITSKRVFIFYLVGASVIQHLVHSFSEGLYLIIGVENTIVEGIIQLFIIVSFYYFFYLIFVKPVKKVDLIKVKDLYLYIFTLISAFIIFVLSVWTNMLETHTVGSFMFDSISCFLLLVIHFGMFERSLLEKENDLMKQILRKEKQRHTVSQETIELINMKCHDLKYQIEALKNSNSIEEREKNFNEIDKAIMIYDTSVKTGNDTLDILLAEKSIYWDRYDIKFSCIADGGKLDFISPSDTYSLFGNALDNAIESVKEISNSEKRVISLNLKSRGNLVSVRLENYFENKLDFKNGIPLSSKNDSRYHGFGIKSIRYITEKYNGSLSITSKNGIFTLTLLFQLHLR